MYSQGVPCEYIYRIFILEYTRKKTALSNNWQNLFGKINVLLRKIIYEKVFLYNGNDTSCFSFMVLYFIYQCNK